MSAVADSLMTTDSPPISAPLGTIAHRTWNVCEGFLGVPGTGKTTLAVRRCLELQATPCYVLCHDQGLNIPPTIPGGIPTNLIRHKSVDDAARQLARDGRGIHCLNVEAVEVIAFADRLAQRSLQLGGGHAGVPVILYIDEAVLATDMTPHHLSPPLKALLALRRHKHVGILWTSQSPGFIHRQMVEMGNYVYLFRIVGKLGAQRLREAGVPEPIIDRVATLPDHEFIRYKLGSPI